MLEKSAPQVQADRFLAVRQLSQQWGLCYVVLKGHQTLMGRSREDFFVNSTGNPQLAQGGSGDLLAGYLGGLLAQPSLQTDPAKTVRYAVWQHGAAADRLQEQKSNWTIEELAAVLGQSPPPT
jgi:NAD(P)H-hydrate epimerase